MRVALVHAAAESMTAAQEALRAEWPEAEAANLLDDTLSGDRARDAAITPAMVERFHNLGRYALAMGAEGLLFTCSAFGPAIAEVREALPIPVLDPTEAAFAAALQRGPRIGLLVTFAGSLPQLQPELEAMAAAAARPVTVTGVVVPDALAALRAGDGAFHDRAVARAAAALGPVDALVLGQFSMARAATAVAAECGQQPITTPGAAVAALRRRCTANDARK